MDPIRIDPQRAIDEATKFNQKLAAGLKTLRTLDDVDYGVDRPRRNLSRRQARAVSLQGREQTDIESAAADRLRAGQPSVHGRSAGRPFAREAPARARRRRLHHRLGISRPVRPLSHARRLHQRLHQALRRCRRETAQGRRDQPARHLPGRRVQPVLRVDLSGKGRAPDHDGHAGRFPHARTTCCRTGRAAWTSICSSTRSATCRPI